MFSKMGSTRLGLSAQEHNDSSRRAYASPSSDPRSLFHGFSNWQWHQLLVWDVPGESQHPNTLCNWGCITKSVSCGPSDSGR